MEEEEQTLILSKSWLFFLSIFFERLIVMHDIYLMYFLLAPPERDETGSPRSFRKDELLQFLRVCYSVIFA
jgi:hypothetical protein